MANEIRVRSNFQSGTITDNPLTNVATTINSAAFASLPAVAATQHLPVILDPTGSAGAPEIVYVTAHTASATSATVVRAQEGSAARQHASGTTWRHGALVSDYDAVLGYAQVTANQAGIGAGPTDLTGLTVTITVPYAGHRVKITGHARLLTQTATAVYTVDVQEGGTILGQIGITSGLAIGERAFADGGIIVVPTAAAHTYKLTATRASGTGTLTMECAATQPAYLLVEDLGPAL